MPVDGIAVLEINHLPPNVSQHDEHVWVDLVELLCLRNQDGVISKADVLDRVRHWDGFQKPLDDDLDDDALPAEINDKWETRAANWFRHHQYREGAFGEFYPFVLSGDGDEISLQGEISPQQRLYIYLLLAANLRYINKSCEDEITNDFEIISKSVLENQLPATAKVHLFSSKHRDVDDYFQGTLTTKIEKLANSLGEISKLKPGDISKHNTGDAGLDIVAWVPTGDTESGLLIVFAQCACTHEEWNDKQFSIHPDLWKQKLTLRHSPSSMVFIPLCQRGADGGWHSPTKIATILIDRVRFVKLIEGDYEQLLELGSNEYVEWVLGNKEDVF